MLYFKHLNDDDRYKFPIKQKNVDDLGWDIPLNNPEVLIHPHKMTKVHTGLAIKTPDGFGCFIKDRSSWASNGIVTFGGVIDEGYTGEIIVIMYNFGDTTYRLQPGEKMAQCVLIPTSSNIRCQESKSLVKTNRGSNGFGSTGK